MAESLSFLIDTICGLVIWVVWFYCLVVSFGFRLVGFVFEDGFGVLVYVFLGLVWSSFRDCCFCGFVDVCRLFLCFGFAWAY